MELHPGWAGALSTPQKRYTEISIGYKNLDVGFDVWCDCCIACARSAGATQWVRGSLQIKAVVG